MATAPQAAANPYADPNTMAVYDQMRQTVSPKEFGDEVLAGAAQVDPQAVAQFKSTLQQIQMPPEALDLLNNMVDEILANPEKYAEIRAKYKEMGAPDEILPEQFDAHFFSALNMAVDQMIAAPSGEQAFAKGGIAELTPVSKAISSYGRNGDTMLAHITPAEARMLRRKGGSGTINPKTGLPEFFNLFKEIGNAFKAVGNAVKSFAKSTVGRIVTTVALGFFLGPAAASFLGATSTAAVAAVSGFVGSAGSTLLAGGNLSQALKAGAVGGLTAGAVSGVTGGAGAFEAGSYTGPTTIGGQIDRFTNFVTPQAAPVDVLRDNVTTSTARDAYVSDLAKTQPELFKTPTAAPADAADFAAKKVSIGNVGEQVTMPSGAVVTQNAPTTFAPTSTDFGAFGEAPINASAQTAAVGNTVAPPISTQPPVMANAVTGNAIAPAVGAPVDATQFPGSFDKTGIMSTQEPSFFDKAKDFYNRNISPSNIQAQGMPAAEQAGMAARDSMLSRIPNATPAMLENAYQTAYKGAMPGLLSTYGPVTALGIGAIGAFGGFSPRSAPVSPYQDMLTGGPGSARDLMTKNPNRYYIQGLPGVQYYNGSVIKPTGMAEGGEVRHFAFGGENTLGTMQYGDFGDYGDYDFGGGGGGWSDTAYPGGIPGYDNYVIGSDNSGITGGGAAVTGVNPDTGAVKMDFTGMGPTGTDTSVPGDLDFGPGATYVTSGGIYDLLNNNPQSTVTDLGPYTTLTVGGQQLTGDQVAGAADNLTVSSNNLNGFNNLNNIALGSTDGGISSLNGTTIPDGGTLTVTGGRTTCPAPEMRILLANGGLKAAGDLQVGDVVKTQHETTLAWGEHPVTHVSIVPDAARLKFTFDDGEFVGSHDHKFFKAANEWVTAKDVVPGDMLSGKTVCSIEETTSGDVVRITIDDAHTYICEGLLSHNKSPLPPTVVGPTVVPPEEPPEEPPVVPPIVEPPKPPIVPTCPAPEMRILLANGEQKSAGELQVGDVVKTQHETTLAWGEHPVTHVSLVPDAARLKFTFDDNTEFVGSHDHKFFKAVGEWVTAKDVVLGDMLSGKAVCSIEETTAGDVVRITIDDAHTYVCEGLLSHNKTPLPPTVVTPPYIPPTVITTPPVVVTTPTYEPPYVPPTVPVIPVTRLGNASTDPRVAGVPGGSYLFTRNTPVFPTGVLSRTMSPYTGGITGLMPRMITPTAPNSMPMPVAPRATPETVNLPELPGREARLMNMGGIAGLAQGGYPRRTGQISGPGTETSDSIPAMLSDGEFVMTAKAVRGAGKGDRRAGAKRMYALMHQLEKNAARG